VRSERTGSIEAALRAGRKLATKATKETRATTPRYVAGLLDVMPYRRLFIKGQGTCDITIQPNRKNLLRLDYKLL
jgi:hypothetical protein